MVDGVTCCVCRCWKSGLSTECSRVQDKEEGVGTHAKQKQEFNPESKNSEMASASVTKINRVLCISLHFKTPS